LCGLLQDDDPVTGPVKATALARPPDAATNDDDLGR